MLKDIFKGLGVAMIVLAFLALLFEAYLWHRQVREINRLEARYEGRDLCMREASDPRLVYELRPDICGANSAGFNDIERSIEKPSGTFRIVLIGDSVAYGHGVPRHRRFGDRLSSLLSANTDSNIEVINLALTGYSTGQELVVLERWGLRYQPDLVLWSYVLNDPAHPVFHDANGDAGRYFNRPTWRGLHYFERKVFEAHEQWRARYCPSDFHPLLHCVYRNEIEENLARLATLAGSIPVMLAITPVLIEANSFANYPFQYMHEDLGAMSEALEFETVDLLQAFAKADPRALAQNQTPWFDPWHPNAAGHELIASHLAQRIAARWDLSRDFELELKPSRSSPTPQQSILPHPPLPRDHANHR